MTKYYKPKEVAELFRISVEKVYDLAKSGKIGSFKPDGSIRFSEHHINEYIKRNSRKAKARKAF